MTVPADNSGPSEGARHEPFYEHRAPLYPCPACSAGVLLPTPGTLHFGQSAESRALYEAVGPEIGEGRQHFDQRVRLAFGTQGRYWMTFGIIACMAPILTDIEHGELAVQAASLGLGDDWQLLVSGEGSQSPFHAWKLAYWLQFSDELNLYALRLDDFGDPSGDDVDEEDVPAVRVVAVWTDPPNKDVSVIARDLLGHYELVGGRALDTVDEEGEFELGL